MCTTHVSAAQHAGMWANLLIRDYLKLVCELQDALSSVKLMMRVAPKVMNLENNCDHPKATSSLQTNRDLQDSSKKFSSALGFIWYQSPLAKK